MQQPQQIQGGLGSLQDPRQNYGLGKLVKKAFRGLKKVAKSPLGKMALLYAGGAGLGHLMGGGGNWANILGKGGWMRPSSVMSNFGLKNLAGKFGGTKALGAGKYLHTPLHGSGAGAGGGFFKSGLGRFLNPWSSGKFSGKHAFLLGSAASLAAPFLFGGGGDEEEGSDMLDPGAAVQRAKNYYSGAGAAGAGLNFMPQKQYVMENFYGADGGRAGYAGGMLVDEDEEEAWARSGAGKYHRQPKAYLNMGGGAGDAQAQQMLMMEYVKYKNKGGTMTFKQFVQAVMQQGQDSASMEQPQQVAQPQQMEQPQQMAMAAYGGRIPKQEGGMMETEEDSEMIDLGGNEKDYRETGGFVELGGEERADDVPARLSKNEFVFTADAVRNAGGGDIDKGSEVMQNMMDNLEAGGEISEESQGLEGAQQMYNQQQMLEPRIA